MLDSLSYGVGYGESDAASGEELLGQVKQGHQAGLLLKCCKWG